VLDVDYTNDPLSNPSGLVLGSNVLTFNLIAGVASVIEVSGDPFAANVIAYAGGVIGAIVQGHIAFTGVLSN